MTKHPAVRHPVNLRREQHHAGMGELAKLDDRALTGLSAVFGWPATVWAFLIVPLLVLLFPAGIRNVVFYLASGWVQLWALPLLTYIGVKLQRSSDAQSEVMHQALTHIALVSDQNKQLLEQNTKLTQEVHALVGGEKGRM